MELLKKEKNKVKTKKDMTILEIKQYLKDNKMTYKDLAEKCNVPESTLKNLFSGATKNPRIDTMQAIERALNIADDAAQAPKQPVSTLAPSDELSDEERRVIEAYRSLPVGKQAFLLETIEKLADTDKSSKKTNRA